MLKMLKAFGILVHYEDELSPAFGGTSAKLAQALVLQAPAVAPAPTASSSIPTAPAAVPCAPPWPLCSPLCPAAKLSYVKAASSKVPLVASPKPSKLSIYTKVGTWQGIRGTVTVLWPDVPASSSPPSIAKFVESKPLGD